jgi:hypothetical protein
MDQRGRLRNELNVIISSILVLEFASELFGDS